MDTFRKESFLTPSQAYCKRVFDIIVSIFCLPICILITIPAWVVATIDTRKNGFFIQERIGRNGIKFRLIKLRTMRHISRIQTTITTKDDIRITSVGRLLRKTKIDELPQVINVLKGDMSFVGPRPDVPGYADSLKDNDKIILKVRPGITGPATLKYKDEESLLASQKDPETYNNEVLWPDKVRINREYLEHWSFSLDLYYIFQTILRLYYKIN